MWWKIWLKVFLNLALVAGIWAPWIYLWTHKEPEASEPTVESTATLVATTPEGTKIYRVDDRKLIVPLVIAVGSHGHSVSVR